jgi:hypothetical protein
MPCRESGENREKMGIKWTKSLNRWKGRLLLQKGTLFFWKNKLIGQKEYCQNRYVLFVWGIKKFKRYVVDTGTVA